MSREERTLIELNVTEEERLAINEALDNIANKRELAEVKGKIETVKKALDYNLNSRDGNRFQLISKIKDILEKELSSDE